MAARQQVSASAEGPEGLGARIDILVHAAAQLSDDVEVHLDVTGGRADRLRRLVRAYGIEGRVMFEHSESTDVRVVAEPGTEATGAGAISRREPYLAWSLQIPGGATRHVRTISELIDELEPRGHARTPRGVDEVFAGKRIAVVSNVPTHYRVPLWNLVSRRLRTAGGELLIFFSAGASDEQRPWLQHQPIEFEHSFQTTTRARHRWGPVDLEGELDKFRPSVVLSGGFSPFVTGKALRFAQRCRIPFGLWSGDTHLQATTKGQARRLQRMWITRRSSFAISYGWLAAEYVRTLAPRIPVVIGRNTAPVPAIPPSVAEGRALNFLAVGQAIPRKGLDVVVDAFRALEGVPCRLTIAGGGDELPSLMARSQNDERIQFLGAVRSDEILACYENADAFLFPSRSDVFGLVLVEAMGSGLPTITAPRPGAVADLAVNERNAIVLESHDPNQWAQTIRRVAENREFREALGVRGRREIQRRWTIDHSADAWIAAIRLGVMLGDEG